ncbi:ATP-binding protein [Cellulomonas sp. KRMCY2]|uniref:ATP-binding protein n=1 Tax=Cellulomonas sp. KRMCY2 TaxID=1304865 RepID=UPI00045E61A3|nr:ATP-binding protein [Cellulomonas sp. KRMCY2]
MSAVGTGGAGQGAPARSPGPRARGWSVRVRLTVLTAASMCVALVIGAVLLTTVLSRGRVAALDDIVRDRATTVAALVTEDRVPAALPVAEPGEIVQLLDADGRVISSSPNASRTLPVVPARELDDLRSRAARTAGTPGTAGTVGTAVLVTATEVSAYDVGARVAVVTTTYRGEPATVVATVPLAEVQGLLRALAVSLVGVVPVLTALLAFAIWAVVGRALAPVEQLRRAAAQVAGEGGPGALPVPRSDDELGALARTLNEMLDRLETAATRQRAFVADAAHELRSPIASLRAGIDVARAHPATYTSAELAADLEVEVLRMQALVDDLLLLARVGSAPVVRDRIDLVAVVHEAIGATRPSDVQLDVTGTGTCWGDRAAVQRVVRNLLDNALRHASSRVAVGLADGSVQVDDDGGGIPVADRERVFERFVRLDDAREREAGGSGLGLAIAREIARENGGDIHLGDSPAGGLSATLSMPTGAQVPPSRAIRAAAS